jgi:hypothetical protein
MAVAKKSNVYKKRLKNQLAKHSNNSEMVRRLKGRIAGLK